MKLQFVDFQYLFLGLLAIFVFGMVYFLRWKASVKKISQILSPRFIKYYFGSLSLKTYRRASFLNLFLAVFLISVALARPQYGETTIEVKSEGSEFLIVIDVSTSMMAEDISPSRLEFVKREVKKFLTELGQARVGVVAFAEDAAIVSPMTDDYGALNLYIDALSATSLSSGGTNMSIALDAAKEVIEGDDGYTDSKQSVIILISDGEDHESGVLEKVKELAQKNIFTMTVGVGKAEGAKVPILNRLGYKAGYLKDNKGEFVITQPNDVFLKELADAGKGAFYRTDYNSSAFERLKADIKKFGKSKFGSQSFTVQAEFFPFIVLWSLAHLLFGLLLYWPNGSSRDLSLENLEGL